MGEDGNEESAVGVELLSEIEMSQCVDGRHVQMSKVNCQYFFIF